MCDEKKRNANFSNLEINFLLECVGNHKDVLENKKTDQVKSKAKKRAWQQISEAFEQNIECSSRISSQLEDKWRNLKRVRRNIF